MTAVTTPGTTPAAVPSAGRTEPAVPLLHREATPYYLLLGASMLLLVLGIVMVFSASSVIAFSFMGSSFAIVNKQVMWVVIGLPLMWIASRLPVKAWRAFAYLGLIVSLALLFLVVFAGTEVNGNKNWLDFGGPFRLQPSELAKFSIVLWGADLLARKQKLLTQWKHLLVPFVPVSGFVIGLVLLGGDLGTAIILVAIVICSDVGGRRPGAAVRLGRPADRPHDRGPGADEGRATVPHHRLAAPQPGRPAERRIPGAAREVRARLRRLVGRRSRRLEGEVGQPARGPHRLHLRDHRRGARPGRHAHRAGAARRASATAGYASPSRRPTRSSGWRPRA